MKTAEQIALDAILLNYNGREGLSESLAQGDVDADGIEVMLIAAIKEDRAQFFDTAGSASVQHYIDTGRYMLHEEVAEMERINQR